MKIEYPVYDITGIEVFYDDDDGSIYTHIPSKGGTLIIDCTTIEAETLGLRRAVLRGQGAPMYPLRRALPDVVALVLSKSKQIIDSKGKVFTINKTGKKILKTYLIKEIYTGTDDGRFVIVLDKHTKRIIVDQLPPLGHIYVSLIQDERLGDIFAGYSSIPQERMIRA